MEVKEMKRFVSYVEVYIESKSLDLLDKKRKELKEEGYGDWFGPSIYYGTKGLEEDKIFYYKLRKYYTNSDFEEVAESEKKYLFYKEGLDNPILDSIHGFMSKIVHQWECDDYIANKDDIHKFENGLFSEKEMVEIIKSYEWHILQTI
jgi:hypothetical protein